MFHKTRDVCKIVISTLQNMTEVKLILSLCLTKHPAIKMYWKSGGVALRILDLGTRWRWAVRSKPWPLYTQGNTHDIGGWVAVRMRWWNTANWKARFYCFGSMSWTSHTSKLRFTACEYINLLSLCITLFTTVIALLLK